MRTQQRSTLQRFTLWGTSVGLLLALGACVAPSTPLPTTPVTEESADDVSATPSSLISKTSAAAPCELTESSPEPLVVGDNEAVFEQFNFRPQEIAIANNAVTITAANHIFSLCQTNNTWSITSAAASEDEAPYDYEKAIAQIADPDYQSLEVNNETYKYRVRLQAEWLTEQLKPETTDPETVEPEPTQSLEIAAEDAVFFELETPDGEFISQQLYTLSELRDAQLGASLGPPKVVGAAIVSEATNPEIWFAATASQGEGESGFASLIHYRSDTGELTIEQPEAIQGDQITSLAVTTGSFTVEESEATSSEAVESEIAESEVAESGNAEAEATVPEVAEGAEVAEVAEIAAEKKETTLWIGTQRSGEGVPYFPASGLVAYRPSSQSVKKYTVTNSQLVGAIPHQLAVQDDKLWAATGNGVCEIDWSTIDSSESWNCWRFTATADLPSDGVEVFDSFFAQSPTATLNKDTVEVLWINRSSEENEAARTTRYEVVYEPGFEVQLSQGGYRITNQAARRAAESAAGETNIFWPGNQWHWNGEKFERGLDEVALNLVGGGPRGLVTSNSRKGFDFDSNAMRGKFDLLELTDEHTKVRYYSGWIEDDGVDVYPTVVAVSPPSETKPNPLTKMAADLTSTQGP